MDIPDLPACKENTNAIREAYDTSNPVIAEILKAKTERLKILQELNKQHQEDFGLTQPLLKNDLQKKSTTVKKSNKYKLNTTNSVRRSLRLQNSPAVSYRENEFNESVYTKDKKFIRPPNSYGSVPGVEVGTYWETRMECSMYGVHRPTVAGIHGGPNGAYSIALSGGYPEDVDEGESFIYTGAGGRDLKGTSTKPRNLRIAPQTKDQQLEGTNLSLVKSLENKLPVRVIRGYKSPSIYAPETGYRYDGLYQVVEYWEDIGKSGHKIYRFKMERMMNQAPPPWKTNIKFFSGSNIIKNEKENQVSMLNNDNSEFQNIVPDFDNKTNILLNMNITCKDVKDIDNEIQMCINSFCKDTAINLTEDLIKDHDTEFYGWD